MKNKFFEGIHGNFGFGCMRFPMNKDQVDYEETAHMVDAFINAGFNYFDTAHGYLDEQSEKVLRKVLVERYPRESYILVNKLSNDYFKKQEDIRPFFEEQLEICGVTYFDFYLLHAQNASIYEKYKKCNAYETVFELKKEGKVKHVGISFHDKAEVLESILNDYPDIEVVQLQFNYVDYNDTGIESRKCYEVCEKYHKPVIVMEPVKGGSLVNLPKEAQDIFDELGGGSSASYAIRFAASFDNIMMVLSGMSDMEQVLDNVSYMKDFKALSDKEFEAIWKVCDIFKSQDLIPCTACKYCVPGCPKKIPIPDLFADMNALNTFKTWNSRWYYSIHTKHGGKASDCIKCGKCEAACPQHLPIRELLEKVAETFDK